MNGGERALAVPEDVLARLEVDAADREERYTLGLVEADLARLIAGVLDFDRRVVANRLRRSAAAQDHQRAQQPTQNAPLHCNPAHRIPPITDFTCSPVIAQLFM